MDKNFYDILNVNQNASNEEIRAQFLKLVKIHHPDMGGNSDTFIKIKEAYDVLSNKQKRKEYDEYLASGSKREYGDHSEQIPFFEKNSSSFFFDMMFNNENFFNQPFSDAFFYNFSTFKDYTLTLKCTLSMQIACYGGKFETEYLYEVFNSNGTKSELKDKISFNIPGFVSDNEVVEVEGKGNEFSSKRGALKIIFLVEKIDGIKRKGLDIYQDVYVNVLDILLARKIKILDLRQNVRYFKLLPGMQYGDMICFKKSASISRNKTGDYYLVIKFLLPEYVPEEDKKKIESLYFTIPSRNLKPKTFIVKNEK